MNKKLRPTTIILNEGTRPVIKEAKAFAIIQPGYLLQLNSDGTIRPHAVQSATVWTAFAIENDLLGKGINDPYPVDDNVLYAVFNSGHKILAKVPANGAAISRGDFLEPSSIAGTLAKVLGDSNTTDVERGSKRFLALETIDNSGNGEEVFIKVEVL